MMEGKHAPQLDRVVEILVPPERGGGWGYGSGYLVAAGVVLTSGHVLAQARTALVRLNGGQWYEQEVVGEVAWRSAKLDIALLEIELDSQRDVTNVPIGALERSSGTLPFIAVGYPVFKRVERSGAPLRESHQITGTVPLGSNVKQGLLSLETVAHPPQARVSDTGEELSPWEGMSGSAVFCRGVLTGVVSLHRQPEGRAALTAVRISALDDLEQVTAADRGTCRRLLGIGAEERIIALAPDQTPDPRAVQRLRVEQLLVDWPLRLADAEPTDLGVTVSEKARRRAARDRGSEYVRRDADEALISTLKSSPFVLVTGPSKAGKSRTALHAAREAVGDEALILAPSASWPDVGVLHELVDALEVLSDVGTAPVILWLDDIGRYLRTGALDARLLRRLRKHEPPVIVLGTISDTAREALREEERLSAGLSGAASIRVLTHADHVRLDATLSLAELERADAVYPDEDFSIGLGARLVDAPRLLERLQAGPSTSPHGAAIVHAAVDWERATHTGGVGQETLWALARLEDYRPLMGPMPSFTDAELDLGLKWSLQREESGVALLYRTGDVPQLFTAFDYIVASADGQVEVGRDWAPVPPGVWTFALDTVDGEGCLTVGLSAWTRSERHVAKRAFRRAMTEPAVQFEAGVLLGIVERELGELEASRETLEEILRRVAEDGHALPNAVEVESTALAQLSLTWLCLRGLADAERDAARAVALAESVVKDDAEPLVLALTARSQVLEASDHRREAIGAMRRAFKLADSRLGPQEPLTAAVASQLSRLLGIEGDAEPALDLARRAIQTIEESLGQSHPDLIGPLVALGRAEHVRGNYEAARTPLLRALEVSRQARAPDHATAEAFELLGMIDAALKEFSSARDRFEQALALREQWLGTDHHLLADTLAWLGSIESDAGQRETAVAYYARAIAVRETALGPAATSLAPVIRALAEELEQLGRPAEAEEKLQRLAAVQEVAFGPEAVVLAATLHHLGLIRRAAKKLAQAEADLQRAVVINETTAGPASRNLWAGLHELGVTRRMAGKPAAAEADLVRAVAIHHALAGEGVDLAVTLHELGVTRRGLGKFAEAEADLKRAAAIKEATSDTETLDLAVTLEELGVTRRGLGKFAQAEADLERAAAIKRATAGPDSVRLIKTLFVLGQTHRDQGKLAEAERDFQCAAALKEAAEGPDTCELAITLHELGVTRRGLGKLAESEADLARSAAINESSGPETLELGVTLHELGVTRRALGRFVEAEADLKRATAIKEASSQGTFGLAVTLHELGVTRQRLGKLEEAGTDFELAAAITEAVRPDHRQLAITLFALGETHSSQGKLVEAEHDFQRVAAIEEAALGPDRPELAVTLHELGVTRLALGKLAQAEADLERAASIKEATAGPDSLTLRVTLFALGLTHRDQGKLAEAERDFQRVAAIEEAVLGPDHRELAGTLIELGQTHRDQGKLAEAEQDVLRAALIQEAVDGRPAPRLAALLRELRLERRARDARVDELDRRMAFGAAARPEPNPSADDRRELARLRRELGDVADAIWERTWRTSRAAESLERSIRAESSAKEDSR